MQVDQQHVARDGDPQERYSEKRPGSQVERYGRILAGEFGGAGFGVGFTGQIREGDTHVDRGFDPLMRFSIHHYKDGAQGFVSSGEFVNDPVQQIPVQFPFQHKGTRHVVGRALLFELIQHPQPTLGVRHGISRCLWNRFDFSIRRRGQGSELRAQRCDGGLGEDLPQGDLHVEFPVDSTDHLHGFETVTAQFEEVVPPTHRLHPQHFLPDRRQRPFGRIPRRHIGAIGIHSGGQRIGQGAAVDLAVRRQRKQIQRHEIRRDHILGQGRAQVGAQRTGVQVSVALHIGGQHPVVALLARHHHGFFHPRVTTQSRLDLSYFDAIPPHLHLTVFPTQTL